MFHFTYYTPTKVVFGKGAEEQVGALVKEQGCKKVLIHYGGGSVVRSGLLDRVKAALDREGLAYAELGGVVPNPRLSLVYQGIELSKKEGVDFILAVGGGSVIDSAKAIAYGVWRRRLTYGNSMTTRVRRKPACRWERCSPLPLRAVR